MQIAERLGQHPGLGRIKPAAPAPRRPQLGDQSALGFREVGIEHRPLLGLRQLVKLATAGPATVGRLPGFYRTSCGLAVDHLRLFAEYPAMTFVTRYS